MSALRALLRIHEAGGPLLLVPSLEDVFVRESILKGLEAHGGSLSESEFGPAIEARLHADVFPRGSEGRVERVAADLAARGFLSRSGGRVALSGDPRAFLGDWFDALGGLTHVDGALHRSPLPYSAAHFDALRKAGVTVVFSMEESVPGGLARAAGLDWRPHFWEDNGKPSFEELDRFVDEALALSDGAKAVAHCKAGLGRTGIAIAAALARRRRVGADEALSLYWSKVPLAREVMTRYGQADFVRRYVASRG